MTPYKLKILNGVLKLKSFADVVLNIFGIKDLGTQTGNVTDGLVDWSIQHLTKTTAQWNVSTTILLKGQLGIEDTETTTFKLKVGDGISTWQQLGYIAGGGNNDFPEHLYLTVVNKTGGNLLASGYKVVRVSDAQGQRLAVDLAQADSDANSTDTIGVVYENINVNQTGKIIVIGELTGLNTTGSLQSETWVDGDVLYLSPTTAGNITNVKPTAPNHLVTLGYVVYSHANQGKIYIKIDNGYELQELHNVYAPSPSNNDSIFWNSSTLRYENKSITTALGYTPANASNVGYTINCRYGFSTVNPPDSSTFYFGNGTGSIYSPDNALIIPKAGTLKQIAIFHTVFATLGSTENSTFSIQVRNSGYGGTVSTTTQITNTYKFNSTYGSTMFTGLNIDLPEGCAVDIKWLTPAWATNPTSVQLNATLYIQ